MSLSNLREQVRAQVRGEQPTSQTIKNLSPSERVAVRAMQRRMERAAAQSNTFDPGVEAARLAVRIPVVGLLRATLHTATILADRIGITVPLEGHVPHTWRILRTYGMDGFVAEQQSGLAGCEQVFNPACGHSGGRPDVMGYHTGADIPNYWAYARNFVLQDHMFEPNASWSLPEHLFQVA